MTEDDALLLGEIAAGDVLVKVAAKLQQRTGNPDGTRAEIADSWKFAVEHSPQLVSQEQTATAVATIVVFIHLGRINFLG